VEHAARELDIACVVSHHLQTLHGLTVHIGSIAAGIENLIHRFRPKLIVNPFFFSTKDNVIFDLLYHYPDVPFFSLNFEQVLSGTNATFFRPKDDYTRKRVNHLAWNQTYRDFLVSWGVDPDKIAVTGNPAFGFFLPQYTGDMPTKEELGKRFGLNPNKPWIFFPMNYAWAFLTPEEIENRIRRGYSRENARIYREFCTDSLSEVCKWWHRAATTLNVEMIIRPRPAIPVSDYFAFLGKRWSSMPKSVHILKDLRVADWAPVCDRAFTSFSTSIFQTLLESKPSWLMEPQAFPEFLKCEVNEIVPALKSESEFLNALTATQPWTDEMKAARQQVVQRWLPNGDPLQNLAQAISHSVRSEGRFPKERQLSQILSYKWTRTKMRMKRLGSTSTPGPNRSEMDRFTEADAEKKIETWCKTISRANPTAG
jgi:hypothetical protein